MDMESQRKTIERKQKKRIRQEVKRTKNQERKEKTCLPPDSSVKTTYQKKEI